MAIGTSGSGRRAIADKYPLKLAAAIWEKAAEYMWAAANGPSEGYDPICAGGGVAMWCCGV